MMSSFAGVFMGLIALVPLVAQWIGLVAMRGQRNGAWWTMLIGTALQSLGTVGWVLAMILMVSNIGTSASAGPLGGSMPLVLAGTFGVGAGALLFAAGFAMHGLSRRAAREREEQLEAMTAAMAEELRILRERAG